MDKNSNVSLNDNAIREEIKESTSEEENSPLKIKLIETVKRDDLEKEQQTTYNLRMRNIVGETETIKDDEEKKSQDDDKTTL